MKQRSNGEEGLFLLCVPISVDVSVLGNQRRRTLK